MKPMQEWLNQPQNVKLIQEVRSDLLNKWAKERPTFLAMTSDPNRLDPERLESQVALGEAAVREILAANAPDEYLGPGELEHREELREPFDPYANPHPEIPIEEIQATPMAEAMQQSASGQTPRSR